MHRGSIMAVGPMVPTSRGWLFHLAVFALGVVCIVGLALLRANHEDALRTAGGMLQLLGILAVAIGLSELRGKFGLPSVVAELRQEGSGLLKWLGARLRKMVGRKPPPIVASGSASISASAVVRGRGRVGPAPNATLEQRVDSLERRLEGLNDTVDRLDDGLADEVSERQRAIASEAERRGAADQELREVVKGLAVGGIHLESIGLAWLSFGVCLATWPRELASWIWR